MTLLPDSSAGFFQPIGGHDVSAWYLLSGSIRLRRCPEVEAILDELRDIRGDEFEVIAMSGRPGEIAVTFDGGSEFTDEGADELDSMLRSLGPRALESAVFRGEYDGEPRVVVVTRPGRRSILMCRFLAESRPAEQPCPGHSDRAMGVSLPHCHPV